LGNGHHNGPDKPARLSNLDSAVEVDSACPFDGFRAPSEAEGLTLAATGRGDLDCGIQAVTRRGRRVSMIYPG
jgi:hypothetical protein